MHFVFMFCEYASNACNIMLQNTNACMHIMLQCMQTSSKYYHAWMHTIT